MKVTKTFPLLLPIICFYFLTVTSPSTVEAKFPSCITVEEMEKKCENKGQMMITCLNEQELKRYRNLKKNCEYYKIHAEKKLNKRDSPFEDNDPITEEKPVASSGKVFSY